MACKLLPCAGPGGLFPLCNSVIHAIMYRYKGFIFGVLLEHNQNCICSYYALSALGPSYQRFLFWKKYITIIQLVQFVIYIVHATLFLFLQTGYPKFIVYLAYVQNPFFFIMFYQFFRATYTQQQNQKKELNGKTKLSPSISATSKPLLKTN